MMAEAKRRYVIVMQYYSKLLLENNAGAYQKIKKALVDVPHTKIYIDGEEVTYFTSAIEAEDPDSVPEGARSQKYTAFEIEYKANPKVTIAILMESIVRRKLPWIRRENVALFRTYNITASGDGLNLAATIFPQ